MARGQQKIQSQQKALEKKKAMEKGATSFKDQKAAADKALKHVCPLCKSMMPDPKTFKQHFENKHPKAALPEELKAV